jgi:hypothetical protein
MEGECRVLDTTVTVENWLLRQGFSDQEINSVGLSLTRRSLDRTLGRELPKNTSLLDQAAASAVLVSEGATRVSLLPISPGQTQVQQALSLLGALRGVVEMVEEETSLERSVVTC